MGAAATSANYEVDTVTAAPAPLTVTITDDESGIANIAGTSVLYTFTFSEAVTGFVAADVTVSAGATKGLFTAVSSTVYTLEITPPAGLEGNMTVDIAAGVATNTAGNSNIAALTSNQAFDMVAPTVISVILADPALTAGETSAVTITFSAAVASFSNADVTVENGTLSTLTSTDNRVWIGLFTPTASITDTSNIIQVLNTYTDVAGNAGALGASDNFTIDTNMTLSDTVKPILTITDDEDMVTANMDGSNSDGSTDANGADILYMFTFSEAVTGFTIDDIVITMQQTDGTVDSKYTAATDTAGLIFKTFTKVSDNVYTLGVRPEAGYEGVMKVSAETSNAVDIVGNVIDATNVSTLSSLQAVDMLAPLISTMAISGNTIVLTFDSPLEAVNMTTAGRFTVTTGYQANAVAAVGVLDNVVTLFMTDSFSEIGGIELLYTDLTTDLTPAIQDLAGNDATSFSRSIADTLAPTAIITMSDTVLSSGDTPTVTFTFSEKVLDFDLSDVTVANGALNTLTTTDGGITWSGVLTPIIGIEDITNTITLATTYTDVAGVTGTVATSGNYTIDTKAPLFVSATGNGANDTISILFDEALDSVNFAPNSMFYVTDGTLTPDPADGSALLKFAINEIGRAHV